MPVLLHRLVNRYTELIVKSKKIEVADVVYINEWKVIMLLIACL